MLMLCFPVFWRTPSSQMSNMTKICGSWGNQCLCCIYFHPKDRLLFRSHILRPRSINFWFSNMWLPFPIVFDSFLGFWITSTHQPQISLHHQPWFLPSDHHSPWRKNAKPLRSLKSGSLGADVGHRREWWAERLSTNSLYMMGIIWNMKAKGWRIWLGNIPIIFGDSIIWNMMGMIWNMGIWWGSQFELRIECPKTHFLAFATGRLGLRDRDGSIVCLLLTSRGYWFLWDVWGSYLPSRKDVRHGSQKKKQCLMDMNEYDLGKP